MTQIRGVLSGGARVIVVLGMHRSGTSALTRVINLLGIDLGQALMPPVPNNNETGFWEHAGIVALNEQMLAALQSSWHDPRPLPDRWWERQESQPWKTTAAEILTRDFGASQLFVVKDPRMCRLTPFWIAVFEELQCPPSFVLMVRDPLEVIASVRARDNLPDWQSNLLWLQHALYAECLTRNSPRVFVTYDQLLSDWRAVVVRIGQGLDVQWPVSLSRASGDIDRFLDPQLRHHRHDICSTADGADQCRWAVECYREISKSLDQGGGDLREALSVAQNNFATAQQIFLPWFEQLDNKLRESEQAHRLSAERIEGMEKIIRGHEAARRLNSKRIEELEARAAFLDENDSRHIEELEVRAAFLSENNALLAKQAAESARLIGAVQSSASWRLTRPLRMLTTLVLRLLELVRWRPHQITLQALSGGGTRLGGPRLWFEMRSSRNHPPCRWCVVSFKARASQGPFTPVLYVDAGDGFSEQHAISLPPAGEGRSRHLIRLPDEVVALRLEIMNPIGDVSVSHCTITEIGKLQAACMAVAPYARQTLVNPRRLMALVRNGVLILKTGGVAALKLKLASHESASLEYQCWIERYDTLNDGDRAAMREQARGFQYQPLISIIMPVYNAPEKWLRLAIESVQRQIYGHWELCIADDASTQSHVRRVLAKYQGEDARIKTVFRPLNGHIAAASNSALELAAGEFIALLDHDDELAEHALFMIVKELNRHPEADLIYSDEDKINDPGIRFDPYFKPDWNPDLLYSHNVISHLGVYRVAVVRELGGFRESFEGSQDYDLALRVIEGIPEKNIRHIPHVLYHWRAIQGSTALDPGHKNYAETAARRAIQSRFDRIKNGATIVPGPSTGLHRAVYSLPREAPLASLIIPTRDGNEILRKCVESVLHKTEYANYEIVIVDNQSRDAGTLALFDELTGESAVRVIHYDAPFNYSAINNFAVAQARGDVVCFLNDDTEVINPDWLRELVSHALRPEIGVVGAKLYYPNHMVQHAGIILGMWKDGVAGMPYVNLHRGTPGYMWRARLLQNFSAVTAACMAMRKSVFEEVGGFDAKNLPVAYNDVDICLRVRERGYRVLWTPYAELFHHESASRGHEDTPDKQSRFKKEIKYMKERWGAVLLNDPAYNPNLALDRANYALAWPPRCLRQEVMPASPCVL